VTELAVPLSKPRPDCQAFLDAVLTDKPQARPRLVEYLVNTPVFRAVVERIGREWVEPTADRPSQEAYWDNFVAFWHHMGYDFVRLEMALAFPKGKPRIGDGGRAYAETAVGPIASWDDFERYPWPSLDEAHFWPYEHIVARLPEGMGLICNHAGGMLEHLSGLMGYETLCLALFDQPDLVAAVTQRVGELMAGYYERLLQLERVIAIFPGDDMGFRSGTLVSPEHLRRYTLPWHAKFAAMTHAAGKPYFLHSCGNLEAVVPDLIETVRIDAKHSFEDAIVPMAEFQRRWGGRIGVLGGVDVDKLARLSPDLLRRHVRGLIDACAPRGRCAFGSGNSVPDYIPVENYLTMVDEVLR
jgi:uroporphyrinogen decarboxylase